jgi:two-component system nitrogen regulation sensor histidine kinase NtrY
VKLRGRFTLTLALTALVPIVIAAVVTREMIASSKRAEYESERANALQAAQREVDTIKLEVEGAADALANSSNPFIGVILSELGNKAQRSEQVWLETVRRLREQASQVMRGLSLQALTVVTPEDTVLITPHYQDATDDRDPTPRERALKSKQRNGAAYFTLVQVRTGPKLETMLVAQASRTSRKDAYSVALSASREVTAKLLERLRGPRTVARLVDAQGLPMFAASSRTSDGEAVKAVSKDPLIIPMRGPNDEVVAQIEVSVSDAGLDQLLTNLTLISAGLALGALVLVVLVGLIVARRTARDLESLVEGSLAAARGDLDHRVPVRSKDEVGAVAAAFNFMMEDLRSSKDRLVIAERIAAWQEIARRLAHEIKNPLTPIQMAMDTLRKTWKKQHPDFAEILDESTTTVLQEADRLKHIVSEFSDFARMPKPEFGRVDLNEIVRSVTALYVGGEAPVEVKLVDTLPELDADRDQLNQVVLNLVENARDAISKKSNGKIVVSTRMGDANDRAMLVVEDNGPGVPPDLKDKVFAPYFTTKHAKGGTGLGLAIVHRIVSDHGGRITITDAKGGGAKFAIELPLRNGTALLASRI